MDRHCRFSDKECWNIHNPTKKGEKPIKDQALHKTVFRRATRIKDCLRTVQILPAGWMARVGRYKSNVKVKVMLQLRRRRAGIRAFKRKRAQSCSPLAGEEGQTTPTFPLEGEPSQQILVQVLVTLLQQARLVQ